jgi:hypothetical protein
MRQYKALLISCAVLLLALSPLRTQAAQLPLVGSGKTVSAGFVLHMAELEYRRFTVLVRVHMAVS